LLVILPGVNNFGGFRSMSDDTGHVQRAIQLAQQRELIGSDFIRLSESGPRRVDQVNEFVAQYAANALKGEWKTQSRRVAHAIIDSGLRHGFDPLLLLAVIENESRFDPTVVGTHGEIGLMQLKPDTAEWIAKKARIHWAGPQSLRDPVANIRLGAAYLSMLRSKFGFDKDLYLAAYNMGVTHLHRLLSGNGHPQIYPQKTIEHYSRIYQEFLGTKPAAVPYAAI
jgi:soluble lytic murein transglycosylase